MPTPPRNAPEAPTDLAPGLVEALAEFDDRLRSAGLASLAPSAESAGSAEGDGLRECVALLEAAWPRARATSRPTSAAADASSVDWLEGPRRFGRFEVVRLLGGGGFSLVYLAEDRALNRKVALKAPRPHTLFQPELTARFLREAQAIGALDHPHIVPVYETGHIGPAVYLAMAYCEGPHLGRWLAEQPSPVSPRLAAAIVAPLADAIQYSHEKGILHRDLKPANVLLFPKHASAQSEPTDEFPFDPKVADFGLAKLLASAMEDTRSSVVLGTPLYMAPEQAAGNPSAIGPWTDIYGLGAILRELLTGEAPFAGDNVLQVLDSLREAEPPRIGSLRSDVPRDLEVVCMKCLAKDPPDRYATARELADDLRNFLHDRPVAARPLGMMSKAVRLARKPARVRDAGFYAIFINAAMTVWTLCAATIALLQLGNVSGQTDIVKGYLIGIASGIVFGAPSMYFGWMTLKRRPWAALGGALLGLASLSYTVPYTFGVVPIDYGGQYKDANSRILVFTMLSVLFGGQAVLCWLAYRVLRREQRRVTT